MEADHTGVDAYLANLPDATTRATLAEVRRMIRAIAPEAVESVSYGMAGYKYKGKPLIYFGANKSHCALYGVNVAKHADDLAGYDTTPQGTLRFPPDQPPPEALVHNLLTARMADIDAGAGKSRKKRTAE